MSGRGRGRGGGRYGGRSNWSSKPKGNNQSANSSKGAPTTRKTLADYQYYIGSAKQASDFSIITQYLILHIRKEFEYGDDIGDAIETRTEINIMQYMPTLQISASNDADIKEREDKQFEFLYEALIAEFVARQKAYQTNKGKAYALIFGQCNKILKNKLQERNNFDTNIKGNPINLISAIEEHAMTYMENKYDAAIILDGLQNFLSCKQKDDEELTNFI
jgi:hypothetical protein